MGLFCAGTMWFEIRLGLSKARLSVRSMRMRDAPGKHLYVLTTGTGTTESGRKKKKRENEE